MKSDPRFCMNSYLAYRTIVDKDKCFSEKNKTWFWNENVPRVPVCTSDELDRRLKENINYVIGKGPVALMLSSGMDSAILASYLPEGTQTYTLHCNAASAIDETGAARFYADINGLKHTVIDIYWEDFEKYSIPLMKQKGYPVHSIEVQIYKAAMKAKEDGIKTLIFGETADIIYGGHSKLLEREWSKEAFVERFSFVDVKKVLKNPLYIDAPVTPYVKDDGNVDVFKFLNGFEYPVSLGFYNNACRLAGMDFFAPYSYTILGNKLDIERIRKGDSKYIIRELFSKIYPEIPVPDKTPLPRPMDEWLAGWEGPLHSEFIKGSINGLTGDQKWYVYALNEFMLHVMEEDC